MLLLQYKEFFYFYYKKTECYFLGSFNKTENNYTSIFSLKIVFLILNLKIWIFMQIYIKIIFFVYFYIKNINLCYLAS